MRIFMHLTQILLAALGLLAAVTASPALAPAARPADCAAKSATVVSMTMRNWDIWHAMSSTAHLKASFTITNPASGDEYRLRNMIFNEDGEWHVCSPLDQGKLLAACEYMMDMSDAKVYFKLSWRCDGATLYTATLSVDLRETKDVPMPVSSLVVSPKSA